MRHQWRNQKFTLGGSGIDQCYPFPLLALLPVPPSRRIQLGGPGSALISRIGTERNQTAKWVLLHFRLFQVRSRLVWYIFKAVELERNPLEIFAPEITARENVKTSTNLYRDPNRATRRGIYAARRCASAAYTVMWCLSVRLSRSWIL